MRKIAILFTENIFQHYTLPSKAVFIYEYNLDTSQEKVYSRSLVDTPSQDSFPTFLEDIIYTPDKKLFDRYFKDCESYDINTQHWLLYGKIYEDIYKHEILVHFHKFYSHIRDWVRYVPFHKLKKVCQEYVQNLIGIRTIFDINKSSRFYSEKVYPAITGIESNLLFVKQPLFNITFNREYWHSFVRCYYHLHTTTGRPSNTYDSINYNALNKKDGSRTPFISRFGDDGILVEFDLDAYHLRLIGQIINYSFPDESIHDYFGKQYFRTSVLTEDQYKHSKSISFRLLYGGLTEEYSHIEFFNKVETFKNGLWDIFHEVGYIESPISGKILKRESFSDLNPSKLFNYLLQTIETEYSVIFINEINLILSNVKSKLILYTYDSFLLDYNLQDGKSPLLGITNILKHSKIKVGRDYHSLLPYSMPHLAEGGHT